MSKASTSCCDSGTAEQLSRANDAAQRRVLLAVLAINLVLFAGEMLAGWWAASTALQADALDALGDAGIYALSLVVVGRSLRWRAGAAVAKGAVQGVFGIAVMAEAVRRALLGTTPEPSLMAIAAGLALVGNLACFGLLWRFRAQDINMRSVWLCSRNDLIHNTGVIAAAGLVALSGHGAPDWIIGAAIALLFLRTSWSILRDAIGQWRSSDCSSLARERRGG